MFTTPFAFMAQAGGAPPPPPPPPWSPLNLPGIENWFKSDTGITTVSGNVSVWQDSLTAKSVIQTDEARRPVYTASDVNFNGYPSLFFNNPGLFCLINNTDFQYSNAFPLYYFQVVRKTAVSGNGFDFVGGGSDANIGDGSWSVFLDPSDVRAFGGGPFGFSGTASGATLLNITILAGLGLTSTSFNAYYNSASGTQVGSFSPSANPLFLIGAYDPDGSFNAGNFTAEVIICRGVELTETDLSQLWSYVETKYAL